MAGCIGCCSMSAVVLEFISVTMFSGLALSDSGTANTPAAAQGIPSSVAESWRRQDPEDRARQWALTENALWVRRQADGHPKRIGKQWQHTKGPQSQNPNLA